MTNQLIGEKSFREMVLLRGGKKKKKKELHTVPKWVRPTFSKIVSGILFVGDLISNEHLLFPSIFSLFKRYLKELWCQPLTQALLPLIALSILLLILCYLRYFKGRSMGGVGGVKSHTYDHFPGHNVFIFSYYHRMVSIALSTGNKPLK